MGPGEEADNADIIDLVVHVLREGIEAVRAGKKGGDPLMRLEKYLICVVSRYGDVQRPQLIDSFSRSLSDSVD